MSQPESETKIYSASITDRGLNERRPLNEDSYLDDGERCIFAVADGVGGAEAGEVASQTAIEVLDEAFRHQVDGADIEDLMELAIQRANASIHHMAQEHQKFSMMATTIVALHLDGNVATIGHVGDSRLYRLTPEGGIIRETEDHSIVEEEVRAGRMTAEQAMNHPSKNVISRALGAEESVEVDMKTIEIAEGTAFLLCSDGITRHIHDNEIRGLLLQSDDLAATCEELKRRCYERGAEDNLTAVIVRVGEPSSAMRDAALYASTLAGEYEAAPTEKTVEIEKIPVAGNLDKTEDTLVPASRIAFPAPDTAPASAPVSSQDKPLNIPAESPAPNGGGSALGRVFIFILFIVAVAGAFYAGNRYRGSLFGLRKAPEIPAVTQPEPAKEDPVLNFEKARREVDRAPADWLTKEVPKALALQNIANPLDSTEPAFLYLYGRALLLSGNHDEASKAFEQAIVRADQSPSVENGTIRKEATLGMAAVTLKSNKDAQRASTHFDEMVAKPTNANAR
jgi:serine/threonine protein phosphatase PrpC